MTQEFSSNQAESQRLPNWWDAYFSALGKLGVKGNAAAAAGINRTTPGKYIEDHPELKAEFAAREKEALDASADLLESEALRRSTLGVAEPVFYRGRQCGAVQRYSDTLLIFLLKARRPHVFRERVETYNIDVGALTDEQLERLARGDDLRSVLASSSRG